MENASKALIIAGAILISILLITIGIILIRSGQEITSTGTAQMASQTIQTFNAKFTAYQGKIKGSAVKSLLGEVRGNNVTDKSHTVTVKSNVDESSIVGTQNYTVSLYYQGETPDADCSKTLITPSPVASEAGYINCICIKK